MKKKINSMSMLIYVLATILFLALFFSGLYFIADEEEMFPGIIYAVSGVAGGILLAGFGRIIELLDSINNKLDKINK